MSDPALEAAWRRFKSRILAEHRLTDQQITELHARLRGQHPSGYSRSVDLDAVEEARDGWVGFREWGA